MKISRQCLLILSENKETGAKAAISKGSEKRKFEVTMGDYGSKSWVSVSVSVV